MRHWSTSVLVLLLLGCSLLTFQQSGIWHDTISLWRGCLRVDPDSYWAHDQLAAALLAEDKVEEAIHEARIALRYPENRALGYSYVTLGSALLFDGDSPGAIKNLREAIRISPDNVGALINLGYALHDADLTEAKQFFERARQLEPENAEAIANLANCEAEAGNLERAMSLLQEAMRISPRETKLRENFRLYRDVLRHRQ